MHVGTDILDKESDELLISTRQSKSISFGKETMQSEKKRTMKQNKNCKQLMAFSNIMHFPTVQPGLNLWKKYINLIATVST